MDFLCFFAGGFWKSVGNMGALGHFLGRFQFSEVLQVLETTDNNKGLHIG